MFRVAMLAACFGMLALMGGVHAQDKGKDAPKNDAPKEKEKAKAPPKITGPAPTVADIHYGDHARQVIDFWQAKSDKPTPVVLMIHGGGWVSGSEATPKHPIMRDRIPHHVPVRSNRGNLCGSDQKPMPAGPARAPRASWPPEGERWGVAPNPTARRRVRG